MRLFTWLSEENSICSENTKMNSCWFKVCLYYEDFGCIHLCKNLSVGTPLPLPAGHFLFFWRELEKKFYSFERISSLVSVRNFVVQEFVGQKFCFADGTCKKIGNKHIAQLASLLVWVLLLYGEDIKFSRCALSLQYGVLSSKILSQNIYSFADKNLSIDVHSKSQNKNKACFHRSFLMQNTEEWCIVAKNTFHD